MKHNAHALRYYDRLLFNLYDMLRNYTLQAQHGGSRQPIPIKIKNRNYIYNQILNLEEFLKNE